MRDFPYTPLFCEENIWQLARALVTAGVDPATLQVLFISNQDKQVALFHQRNGGALGHVVWDYHVILRRHDGEGDRIYDFDSQLPFPCPSRDYLEATFGRQRELPAGLRATLRVIPAAEYLRRFYSDRSHMQGVVPPPAFPPWAAITPPGAGVTRLDEYWDMGQALAGAGRTITVSEFVSAELNGAAPTQID